MKRLFDLCLALGAVILTLPVVMLAALLVWAWDRKNPLYVSLRVRDQRSTFPMYKLRSMTPDADRQGGASTSENDTRLTPVGRLLRALKVDELPQLWNVLIGDMSLVGPRAQVVEGAVLYTAEENRLFAVRPGITDFASIVFADEGEILTRYEDTDRAYDTLIRPWKSRLGLVYVEHHPLWIDAALVALTVVALFSKYRARRGVQAILRGIGASRELVSVAAREYPLVPALPPGGAVGSSNGPYRALSLAERVTSWRRPELRISPREG